MNKIAIAIVFGFISANVEAQFSSRLDQFYLDPATVNPAAIAGYKEGNVSLFYNRTYAGLPGSPKNMLLNVSLPSPDNRKGFGIQYLQESAGFSQLHNAYASYAYSFPLGDEVNLGLGVSLGVLSQNFDATKAVYIGQNDPVVQSLMFSPSATRADLRASAYFTASGFSLGVSSSRLPKPRFDYTYYNYSAKYSLQNLTSVYVSYDWELSDNSKLKPSVLLNAYDFNYMRYQGNLTYVHMDKFWVGFSFSDATHVGGNIGIEPVDGVSVGYQINYQSGVNSQVLGPVHEFYLGFGLGSMQSSRKKPISGDVTDNQFEDPGLPQIKKRRYKEITVNSLNELQNEGPDLDTAGITIAVLDKKTKTPGIYLVVGLHSDENKANRQIKDLYMRGTYAYKFFDPVNNSYYIYFKQFASAAEASRFIMNNDTGFPQAWIREVK